MCKDFDDKKRKEKKETEERELRLLRNATKVWRFINRKRGRKGMVKNSISRERWKGYFRELLEGESIERKKFGGEEDQTERSEEAEGVITERKEHSEPGVCGIEEEDIRRAIKRIKHRKAARIDGIPMKAWMYGGAAVRMDLKEVLNQV